MPMGEKKLKEETKRERYQSDSHERTWPWHPLSWPQGQFVLTRWYAFSSHLISWGSVCRVWIREQGGRFNLPASSEGTGVSWEWRGSQCHGWEEKKFMNWGTDVGKTQDIMQQIALLLFSCWVESNSVPMDCLRQVSLSFTVSWSCKLIESNIWELTSLKNDFHYPVDATPL